MRDACTFRIRASWRHSPSGDAPPELFAQPRHVTDMEQHCAHIEREFGALLNSFPGDPLPQSIQPHARVYSLAYLALRLQQHPELAGITPIVMLDDVQELYPDQRRQIQSEFVRRAAIPRWLAVRSQVLGLEELISLEGAEHGREYREIALDEIFQDHPSVFGKFSANVIHRRLQVTDSLQQVAVSEFRGLLGSPEARVGSEQSSQGNCRNDSQAVWL